MTETRESLLQHYTKVRAELEEAMKGLSDAQMTQTTLDGWSVKDNLAHIALWDDLRADEIIRISQGFASTLKMSEAQDQVYNEMGYELRTELSLAQVRWEWEHSGKRLFDAINAAPPEALDAAKYGEAGLVSHHPALHAEYIRGWRGRLGY